MYDATGVATAIRQQFGGLRALANSVGHGASSETGMHLAAVQFYTLALALTGSDALGPDDADWATAELARHDAALVVPTA